MNDLRLVAPAVIEQRQEDHYFAEAKALARRHNEEDRRHTDVTLDIARGWLALREKLATEMFGPKPMDPTLYDPWLRLDRPSVGRATSNPNGDDAKFYARWSAVIAASGLSESAVQHYTIWARDPKKLEQHRERNRESRCELRAKDGLTTASRSLANRLKKLLLDQGEQALVDYVMKGCPRVKQSD